MSRGKVTMNQKPDLTGLVLAGGRSTRFGADKAGYAVGGQAMIERVRDAVAAVAAEVWISVAAEGAPPGLPRRARYVRDHYRDAGPLAGLHAGLHALETPWLLAVACDLPFLTPDALRTLLAARTPEADAVVARTPDGRRHPLCACYHARTLPVAAAQLEAGHLALHAFLDRLENVRYADLPDAPLRNVNTPSDLP